MSLKSADPPLSVRIRVAYPDKDAFIQGYWPNISRGGLFIQTKTPQPVGTRLLFEITQEDGDSLLRGRARVSWIKNFAPEKPDRPHGMGLRFIELDEASQDLIDRVVEHRAQMRGTSGASVRSKTVELQTLAEEIHTTPLPQPPIEVRTEELSASAPANGNGQGSSGQGQANAKDLLRQAEQRLQEILAGTAVDDAKVAAARIWARRTCSLEHRNGVSQLEDSEASRPVLETPQALAALEQLLGLTAVPLVVPLSTEAPEPRAVTLPRPELAPLESSSGPLDDQTAAHEVVGLEGVPRLRPFDSSDGPVSTVEPSGETMESSQREDTATVSTRLLWPPQGDASEDTPPVQSEGQPEPIAAPTTDPGKSTAEADLAENLNEQAYADALLTSTAASTDMDRNTVESDFDLSEPDDPATPGPIVPETTLQSEAWPDSQPGEPEGESEAAEQDEQGGGQGEEAESAPDGGPELSAEHDSLLPSPHSGAVRPHSEETHVELDLNDLEFMEENLAGPDDGSSDTQQDLQAIQTQAAPQTEVDQSLLDTARDSATEGTASSDDPAQEDSKAASRKRKKKNRSGIFKRLLGKDD